MKLHIGCGDIYLKDYINCDIDGLVIDKKLKAAIRTIVAGTQPLQEWIDVSNKNPNMTTLDKYFKKPFEMDASKRQRKPFILDLKMNVMEKWPFENESVDEIVTISFFEHFEHHTELPHIISEAHRVLKPGGVWKFDFPDIKKVVELYHDINMEFCAEQIYCNHKNKYSVHQWGYSPKTIPFYLISDKWNLIFSDVVKHDYPMTGCWATKK